MNLQLDNYTNIPLYYGTKIPKIRWTRYIGKKPPKALQRYWFSGPLKSNRAIIVEDNLAVLDFDDANLYEDWVHDNWMPSKTLTVETGRGFHAYFHVENGTIPVIGDQGIDIKTGGIVVIPTSKHQNGSLYKFSNENEIVTIQDMDAIGVDFKVRDPGKRKELEDGSFFPTKIEQCVELLDLHYVLSKMTKLIPYKEYWRCRCPFHNDRHPSMYVWDDHFYCFADGCWANRRRDVVDIIARKHHVSIKVALDMIMNGIE
jgi:hypothetical protein